ncbi:unnamed protein product [Rotaria sordida]|uniref:Uncharacterized protein n=2 Tax=Rotaria sordida TaxID=392033 RepID=A0A815T6T7_9BILA|nr:unnamed protein product [Rotaria sordida]CAF1499870.1 unnamed protein product [Rotaria sordida]CAF1654747.1 unnamed protein product [Rotaria sordida]CAF4003155.1 unnamed protein product [Rotaria sordida]CAF4084168.1 unnamed protein product [Rotaria sordida]
MNSQDPIIARVGSSLVFPAAVIRTSLTGLIIVVISDGSMIMINSDDIVLRTDANGNILVRQSVNNANGNDRDNIASTVDDNESDENDTDSVIILSSDSDDDDDDKASIICIDDDMDLSD